jgi:high-affinity Fe2+/Pb2+ permease
MIAETIASTALIVAREGFESLLLTAMITTALPKEYKPIYYMTFFTTWILTMIIGWQLVAMLAEHIEHIENILKIIAGVVLIYVFVNSRAIFEHAREHVEHLDTVSFLSTNITVFLIVLREAIESTVFLRSNAAIDSDGTIIGIGLGIVIMLGLLKISNNIGEHITNKIVFRYLGPALVLVGCYYIYSGGAELLEIFGYL